MNDKLRKYLERHLVHQEAELVALAAGYGIGSVEIEVIRDQVEVLRAEHPQLDRLQFMELIAQALVVERLTQAVEELVVV